MENDNSENKKFKKENMEKRKRPCEVNSKRYERNGGKCGIWVGVEFKGIFHEFGTESVANDEHGFTNQTIAIVEDESGQVHTVNPNHVKFLDK